ncbi:Xylose operon regulatory protein [Planctomycetes bacterium CA13]|uniref:Xylose operon regulatory protein n=1 Tax=Novipirellula herctigrandis TaxID=2527986 RepID=A0A5C5ZCM2_9BACT|nr:Xylose operon regulatory protein [Planctomycetes bacterium CA13]
MTIRDTPNVALLIETSRGYGRQMLRGIVRYARLHGPWGFYITPGDFVQALPQMQQWGGTGIIARIETQEIADAILETGLPTIALDLTEEELKPSHPLSKLSEVSSDSKAAARMAAEHLLERGFQNFAFVGNEERVWSKRREKSFCEAIAEAGFKVNVYNSTRTCSCQNWGQDLPNLSAWLQSLPKPTGTLACNDSRGRDVLEACRTAGINVPEELAVVGVDNDELLCELANPPLSSVAFNAEGTGYQAAALLDRMMQQKQLKPKRLKAKPLHVVTRRSTDIVAIADPDISAALRFIHNHATEPIQVEDVVRHLGISRRKLEVRFQQLIGRTLHAELHRVRMERARRLLAETELPIPKIAESTGYSTPSYFIQVFRSEHDTTPAKYRRQLRD